MIIIVDSLTKTFSLPYRLLYFFVCLFVVIFFCWSALYFFRSVPGFAFCVCVCVFLCVSYLFGILFFKIEHVRWYLFSVINIEQQQPYFINQKILIHFLFCFDTFWLYISQKEETNKTSTIFSYKYTWISLLFIN